MLETPVGPLEIALVSTSSPALSVDASGCPAELAPGKSCTAALKMGNYGRGMSLNGLLEIHAGEATRMVELKIRP